MNEKENPTMKENDSIPITKSINRKKLEFYSESNIMVHIKLITGDFRNGYIGKEFKPEVWEMKERKMGDIKLFEDEISKIEDYTKLTSENE